MPVTCCMFSLWRGLWGGRAPEEEEGRGRQVLVLLASSWLNVLRTQRAHCRVMPAPPQLAVTSPTRSSGFSSYSLGLLPPFLPTVPSATSSHRSGPCLYLPSKASLLPKLELATKSRQARGQVRLAQGLSGMLAHGAAEESSFLRVSLPDF